jgi:hypothetical protein
MGKGGGGGGQTQSTVTNTNIPEYARGYVENMLGATQHQLFNTTTDPATGQTTLGSPTPYKAYGGTYDDKGNMTSYDPSKGIAGFSPLQEQAQRGIAGMQMPGNFDAATQYTADAMQRAANAGYNPAQFGMDQVSAPNVNYFQMNQPQNVRGQTSQGVNLGNAPTAQAQTGEAAQLGASPEAQAAQMQSEQAGITQLGNAPTYQGQQLGYNPQDVGYDRVNAPNLQNLQMQGARDVGTRSFTDPGARQQYMDPYMQDVVDAQVREEQRAASKAEIARRGMNPQAGSYNSSANALQKAENARNLNTRIGDIRAKGLQSAYQSGMGQYNTEAQNRLQADLANQQAQQQTGVQNLSAALQTQGLGAQTGLTAQQLNQAAGMQTGQFNQQQQYNTALQNAQLAQQQQLANQGLQGQYGLQQGQMNQAINLQNAAQRQAANAANQAARNQIGLSNQAMQGQYGLQQGQMNQQMAMGNVANRQQTALANQALQGQYGLNQGQLGQANQQFNAQQRQAANLANQQMGYNTGMQNLQANLGVQQLGAGQNLQSQLANQQMRFNTQQAGEQSRQFGANYGQQMNAQQLAAAQQLGGLGQNYLSAQQGLYGFQNQIGGQQQQQQQQILNQAIQDYSNAQQYPLMQLGTMSNMLRGLPMQAATTNMYQAAPNALTQGIGAIGAYGALNNAFGGAPTGRKEGGVIHAAQGGIMSYDVGGEIESTLSKMGVDDLKRYAKESSSPSIKQMAARLIQEKSMPVSRMARGGILAFARGNKVKELEEANAEGLASPDELTAMDVQYSPNQGFGGALTKLLADRHAQSFGTRPTTPAAAPAEPPPPPSAFAAGPNVNPQDARLANSRPPVASPAPPVPPPQGIAQAAAAAPVAAPRPPAGPAPTPAPAPALAGVTSAPAYPGRPDIPDTPEHIAYRTQAAAANANANKTVAQHLAEIKAEQVAAGFDPENTGMREYREKIMAERANIDDEAKRQKNLRLAEFFASWGSTPGATLVAGMTALKKTIPTLIEDEKERKKAMREADKIIYELEQSERLEKKGNINAAADRRQNAAKIAEPFNSTLAKLAQDKTTASITAQGDMARFASQTFGSQLSAESSKYSADSSAAASKYTADAGVRAAQIREQSAHADRVANRQTADENKRFGQYQAAAEQERRALSRIATEENGDQYKADVRLLESGASSTNPTMIEMRKQAEKRVNARKEEWNTIRENAKRDTDLAYSRLTIQGDTAPPRGGATAPPPGHTLAGYTPDGKPVYKNAQGKTFVGQ